MPILYEQSFQASRKHKNKHKKQLPQAEPSFQKKKKTTTAEPDKTTCFVLALLWTPEVLKKTENLNILPNIKQNTTI